jgi:CRP/FNR family transcriptional regulator
MKTELNTIGETPLFRGMDKEHLIQVHRIAQQRSFNRGDAIFWEDDPGIGFYIVMQGKVKIYKTSLDGKEQILHIYGPGNPFGEVPVFSGHRFPANAQALEKSRLLFFPRSEFISLIAENPSLALNMLAVLSMRLRQFAVQIEHLSLKEVPARLAAYLILLSGEQNNLERVTLPISKGQLASLLGTIPETLSRIFNKMSGQGLITVSGREIELVDGQGIEDLSENGRLGD